MVRHRTHHALMPHAKPSLIGPQSAARVLLVKRRQSQTTPPISDDSCRKLSLGEFLCILPDCVRTAMHLRGHRARTHPNR
eukprot:2915839-Prymnesium_polylepis.2